MRLRLFCVAIALCVVKICIAADVNISGDISIARNSAIIARVQFDYSDMTVKGMSYTEYINSKGNGFSGTTSMMELEKFIPVWNQQMKDGIQLSATTVNAEYKVFIIVRDMDPGHYMPTKLAGPNAGGAKMTGTIYFFKGDDYGHSLLTVEFENTSGLSEINEEERLQSLYVNLAMKLVRNLRKAKASEISSNMPTVTLSSGIKNMISSGTFGTAAASSSNPVPSSATVTSDETESVSTETVASQTSASVFSTEASAAAASSEVSVPEAVSAATAGTSVGSSVDFLRDEKRMSVVIDFSNALIDDKTEEEFIDYMVNYVKEKERNVYFADTWQQCINEQFMPGFISKANDALRKKNLDLRLVSKQGSPYTLKIVVDDIDLKGGNKSDYLIIETETGNVVAQISDEVKGLPMSMGKIVNMIEFSFKSAGDKFGCDIANQFTGE